MAQGSLSDRSAGLASSTTATVHRRLLVQRDFDLLPFVWRGLLPLLGLLLVGLFALWPFARQTIEASVIRHVSAHLEKEGMGWAKVAVSGQQVLLSGSPPQLADGAKAVQAALTAPCPTWAGPQACPVAVVGAFLPAGAVVAPTVAAPSLARPASAATAAPTAATATDVAKACAADLNRLVEGSRIQFASGRADIAAASHPLLDKLAEAAKQCPGNLRVEGHTDNVGLAEANKVLSLARADAVKAALVSRGLNEQRIQSAGFGADRPLGDNTTNDGRAQNRRIEFHAAGSN